MKIQKKSCVLLLPALVLVPLLIITGNGLSNAKTPEWSRVVFYVQWYDVGKAALEGLKGVKSVEKGFHKFKEINTVFYDPALINIDEMEKSLKNAGTYLETREK